MAAGLAAASVQRERAPYHSSGTACTRCQQREGVGPGLSWETGLLNSSSISETETAEALCLYPNSPFLSLPQRVTRRCQGPQQQEDHGTHLAISLTTVSPPLPPSFTCSLQCSPWVFFSSLVPFQLMMYQSASRSSVACPLSQTWLRLPPEIW